MMKVKDLLDRVLGASVEDNWAVMSLLASLLILLGVLVVRMLFAPGLDFGFFLWGINFWILLFGFGTLEFAAKKRRR